MGILIENRQQTVKINPRRIRSKIRKILNALASEPVELSLVFVHDSEIAMLNQAYLHRSGPTNVISFPMREGEFGNLHPEILGDVVISVETAAREAKELSQSVEERIDFLLVHGILHLFGYDHEKSEESAREMEEKSDMLIDLLSKSKPALEDSFTCPD
jgi:probable rRNA maturation factor